VAVADPRIDPRRTDDRPTVYTVEGDLSRCLVYLRTLYIPFLTGSYRPRDAGHANPDRVAVDVRHAGEGCSAPLYFAAAHADDRVATAAIELEAVHREVGVCTPGVAEQVLGRIPEVTLERAAGQLRVRPSLDRDGEIPPPLAEVLREVFHIRRSAGEGFNLRSRL